jgi:tetratricopeptide (TPR) repeat protein
MDRQALIEAYSHARDEIKALFEVGTDKARVMAHLREAKFHIDRGDYDHAHDDIEMARATAWEATERFLDALIAETTEVLLQARTSGADISQARPALITAKKHLNAKDFQGALSLCERSVHLVGDVDEGYRETLVGVMGVNRDLVRLRSIGLELDAAKGHISEAVQELERSRYNMALNHVSEARRLMEAMDRKDRRAWKAMSEAVNAIRGAVEDGADPEDFEWEVESAKRHLEDSEYWAALQMFQAIRGRAESFSPSDGGPKARPEEFARAMSALGEQLELLEKKGFEVRVAKEMHRIAERHLTNEEFEIAGDYYMRAQMALDRFNQGINIDIDMSLKGFNERISLWKSSGIDTSRAVKIDTQLNEALDQENLVAVNRLKDQLIEEMERLAGIHAELVDR